MKAMLRLIVLSIVAVISLSFAVAHLLRAQSAPEAEPPLREPPRSVFDEQIAAAGIIEPLGEVIEVGTEVAGVVVEVAVQEGDTVRRGDLLFRLDDRWRRAQYQLEYAAWEAAQAEAARWRALPRPEDLPPLQARVKRAWADLELARDQFARAQELYQQRVTTEGALIMAQQQLSASQAAWEQAQAEYERTRLGAWEKELQVQEALVHQAEARVRLAETELERLEVRAPCDATVLSVDVRTGEWVGMPSSKPLIRLGDLSTLHVRVEIDEHDVPRFRPGLKGVAFCRGDTRRSIPLEFVRIEPYTQPRRFLTGEPTERLDTRVLPVIYAVALSSAERQGLFVGQQLDVFLDVSPR
ncbi:MAG: hypothetical protein KatS3mg114_1207 [Planctomycetaceae bacterium]|nr:MAG: hypothetical protein KatS3mg114_1207 [Planctomycetaceae bacterium]